MTLIFAARRYVAELAARRVGVTLKFSVRSASARFVQRHAPPRLSTALRKADVMCVRVCSRVVWRVGARFGFAAERCACDGRLARNSVHREPSENKVIKTKLVGFVLLALACDSLPFSCPKVDLKFSNSNFSSIIPHQ